jgi:hypothetical protein
MVLDIICQLFIGKLLNWADGLLKNKKMEFLYCDDCKKYTDHKKNEDASTSCNECGAIYDYERTRYVITGPDNDKDTKQAKVDLLEKDPSAIIISESSALDHRMRNFPTHPRSEKFEKLQPIKKIGRNDPCPCGSGKKYKKCCL